jgi:predicted RNase H-like HicB family nuclease
VFSGRARPNSATSDWGVTPAGHAPCQKPKPAYKDCRQSSEPPTARAAFHRYAIITRVGNETFTAYVERDSRTGLYVGVVPGLAGVFTRAATLGELQANLKKAIQLMRDARTLRGGSVATAPCVGMQRVSVSR